MLLVFIEYKINTASFYNENKIFRYVTRTRKYAPQLKYKILFKSDLSNSSTFNHTEILTSNSYI